MDEVLKARGLEPIEELLKLMPQLEAKDQAKLWLELATFIHPKPKDFVPEDDGVSNMSISELVALVKEKLPELEAG